MTHVGTPYKQRPLEDTYDAVVIGSGVGGLTAAALLAKHAGKRVLVLERHYTAGGFTHVFRRPKYEWDVGVHYVGRVNVPGSDVRAAFDHVTDGRLRWHAMPDVYDRVQIADRHYDFPTGLERFRDRMRGYFPNEAAAIDRYLGAVLAANRASTPYMAERALPAAVARLIGGTMRAGFLRYADRTTGEVLHECTRDPELTAVLTGQWGDYGLPPAQSSFAMHAAVVSHYLEGAAYPVGGASEIASSIAPAIEAAGGDIVVAAEVAEILLDRRGRAAGVRMADGRDIRSPLVISDAGAVNTFARLLPPGCGPARRVLEEIKDIPPSLSHVCLYVGLTRGPGSPEFDATNLWIYEGPDHDAALARFTADPEAPWPFLFMSFPSAKDPTFADRYPGRATIEIVAPMPYRSVAPWAETGWRRRGTTYDAFKQALAARLLDALDHHVPSVRGRIDYTELSTPLSTRHFANYAHGEIYGLAAVPARFRVRTFGARTPIPNLYLTGQDACSAGVTGALFGGVLAASAILGRNLAAVVTRPARRPAANLATLPRAS